MIENAFLRRATIEDMELLFQWANDPYVRSNSFSTNEISWEEHQQWFARTMQNESVCVYIYCWNDCPIGQGRIDMAEEKAYIGYSIEEKYRGHGHGKNLLRLLEITIQDEWPRIATLIGQVKVENEISAYAFQKSGYLKKCIQYEKKISAMKCYH